MKRFDRIMAVVMSVTGAAYLIFVIWQFWDRSARPEFYAVNSAPWYTSMEIMGLIAAALCHMAVLGPVCPAGGLRRAHALVSVIGDHGAHRRGPHRPGDGGVYGPAPVRGAGG